MNKRVKLCLALFLAFAVIVQYSFSPQVMIAYGGEGDTVTATEASDQTEPTQATTAPKPAPEPSTSSDSSGSSGSSDSSASSDSSDATEPTESTEASDDSDGSGDDANTDAEDPTTVEEETVVDEEALEEEEEYPAVSFTRSADGMTVKIHAPEGALPEGATVKVVAVPARSIENAVENLIENSEVVKAVDITFYDKDGKEIEPKKDVSVTFTSSAFNGLDNAQVVHIKDSGAVERVSGSSVSGNKAAFKSDEFSVYVVVETGEDARLLVKFMNGETEIASMYVKKDDNMEQVLYDPGAGELADGVVFKGWTTDPNYTSSTTPLSIAQVRTAVEGMLPPAADGTPVTYYAMLFKSYQIDYLDDRNVSLGGDEILFRADDTTAAKDYTVKMEYTPADNQHNFEGWNVSPGSVSNVVNYTGEPYENGTAIQVKGNVTFTVNAPEGNWLVFDENGSGAKYNAPHFYKTGETTAPPCADADMTRRGFKFGGWFDTKAHADAHGNDPTVTEGQFTFGEELTEYTTVYASWIPNTTATYTVIFWEQNISSIGKETLSKDDYDLKESVIVEDGVVGQPIPLTITDNGDEDYATVGGKDYKYTGFCAKDPETAVDVTPEGDAVLNVYYDRIKYNFRFYLYRNSGNNYQAANNSGSGSELSNVVTWNNPTASHPTAPGKEILEEDGYHYFVLSAYYGQDISGEWPTYDQITWEGGYAPVSYVMMVGTKLKPQATSSGSGTVKGIISVMNENILGKTNDANGNYVVVRFPAQGYNDWRYHIWYEMAPGTTPENPQDPKYHYYNNKWYHEEDVLEVRSSNQEVSSQNQPQYTGFKFVAKKGQNWNAQNPTSWREGGALHLNFVYDREAYKIFYLDGNYVNGNDETLKSGDGNEIKETPVIEFGTNLSSYNKGGTDYEDLGDKDGFVFEGWYSDQACKNPYTFTTMPVDGISVYAKWRQIEYRVFLHSNADGDDSLDWGSASQKTNFRVSYGGKVSAPTGLRDDYEFVGWYTDSKFNNPFNKDAFVLNETTVTAAYDKTKDFTDPSDKWGNAHATTNADKDRFWITKKLDLYACWREKVQGAEGIDVVYDPNGGTNTASDTRKYVDHAKANAISAPTPPKDKIFEYWQIQTWDPATNQYVDTTEKVYPGGVFSVLKSNAKVLVYDWAASADPEETDVKHIDNPTPGTTPPDKIHTTIKTATYTVQLKAVYKDVEVATPTHIAWYSNYGGDNQGRGELYRYDVLIDGKDALGINTGVPIYGLGKGENVPTRSGYSFLGWTKTEGGTTADFLVYDGSKYTVPGGTKAATEVAADEARPYDDLYAVWSTTLQIKIKGNTASKVYNGSEQNVTGFTVEYKVGNEDWTTTAPTGVSVALASGKKAEAKGTNVKTDGDGKYMMELDATSFEINVGSYVFDAEEDLTIEDGWLEITPLNVIVKVEGNTDTKTYNGSAQSVTGYTVKYKAGDEDWTTTAPAGISVALVDGKTAEAKGTNAGEYEMGLDENSFSVIAPGSGSDVKTELAVNDGKLTINPAPVTITADNKTKVIGAADPTLTATVTGLVGSDKLSYSLTREPGEAVGTYKISVVEDSIKPAAVRVDNYYVTTVPGTLTITDTNTPPTPPPPTPTPDGDGGGPAAAAAAAPIVDTPVPTTIDEPAPPKAVNAYWALINLLCAIATALLSLIMLIRYFGRRKEEEELTDPATGELVTRDVDEQRGGLARIASLIPAIGGIIAFILTEDMSLPMAMVDKWTVLMIVILAIQAGVGIVAKLRDERDDEDEEEATA